MWKNDEGKRNKKMRRVDERKRLEDEVKRK